MRLTMKDKLKICEDHIKKGISLSHLSEKYGNYELSNIKYVVNLYKKYGLEPFLDRQRRVYKRDTKLLAISQALAGQSLRSVGLEFALIDPGLVRDWVKKNKKEGEAAIQDTHPRANYLLKEERFKAVVDRKIQDENERLRAEIAFLKKSQSLARKLEGATVVEKTRIVSELRTSFKFRILLGIAKMAPSVYYYNLKAMKNKKNKYESAEQEIERLFIKVHKRRCGYHQIYYHLKRGGWTIGKNKVLEIMKRKGFAKVPKNKWRQYNSYEGNLGLRIPNIMNQDFSTDKPYQKAGTDVTEFPLLEASVYLSPVIDFHSREVLSYVVGTDAKVSRIANMIDRLKKNHGNNIVGMMIQSDQGIQYQNSRYIQRLKKYRIVQSMNRRGNCLDNSPTENFFGRLKQEIWDGQKSKYDSAESLIETIHEYVNYYNEKRIVMKTKMTPKECRMKYLSSI